MFRSEVSPSNGARFPHPDAALYFAHGVGICDAVKPVGRASGGYAAMAPSCVIALALAAAAAGQPFVSDGNVVGPGAEWTQDYRVVIDGDDARISQSGYEFHDIEDLDEVCLWVDLSADSLRVAWKTMAPPYPNRSQADYSGTLDLGTFGILLDADADPNTGVPTSLTRKAAPTYAYPVIGADFALALTFERSGEGPLTWEPTVWDLSGVGSASSPAAGTAAFGFTFDGGPIGPNARWTEGAWCISSVRAAWEPVLGRPILREGNVIGIAGFLSTPVLFGLVGEEITNGGYFLVGWGPVRRDGNATYTMTIHDLRGNEVVRAGLPVRYDAPTKRFLVDGEPTLPYLGEVIFGDASGDRLVTAYDASLVLRFIVGIPGEISPARADVTGNGTVTAYDAALILQRVLDPSYRFPVELSLRHGWP